MHYWVLSDTLELLYMPDTISIVFLLIIKFDVKSLIIMAYVVMLIN